MNGAEVLIKFRGDTKDATSKITGLTKSMGAVTKSFLKVSAGVSVALGAVVAKGVKSYADLEQNLGGVETLFKDSADKVIENAKRAYKTAGVSANEYMAGVTSFSASLLQSLAGDTNKAADVADMAFRDMSDNANKFGTDMSAIQVAYQGFAKQNYTMLDNLKLGYGGTKTEMERLLKDAQKLTGQKYDISNLSDVYNAIHAIQENLGVTGTTAEEAEKTISGSVASMKAAFDNFLNGSGSPEALATTISNVLSNVSGAILKIAPGILSGLVSVFKETIPQAIKILVDLVPQLLDAVSGMINSIFDMVSKDTSKVEKVMAKLINSIVSFITSNIPKIIQIGLTVILAFARGLAESIPKIIPQLVKAVMTIIRVFIENIDLFIDAGIKIIFGLISGIIQAIPVLLNQLPIIIRKLVTALIGAIPLLINGAVQLVLMLVQNLPMIISSLISAIPYIITSVVEGLLDALPLLIKGSIELVIGIVRALPLIIKTLVKSAPYIIKQLAIALVLASVELVKTGVKLIKQLWTGFKSWIGNFGTNVKSFIKKIPEWLKSGLARIGEIGLDIVKGIGKGITNGYGWIKSRLLEFVGNVKSFLKKIFKIGSPSKLMADEIGQWIPKGIAVGITANTGAIHKAMSNMQHEMTDVINGTFGLSPTVTGTASTHFSPEVNVTVQNNMKTDPLGQVVNTVKTFSGGAKNDYNYGIGG